MIAPVLGRRFAGVAAALHLAAPALAGLVALAGLAGLAGCGNSRTPVPSVTTPSAPQAFRTLRFRAAGIRLEVPRTWTVAAGRAPLLTTVTSGAAVVALWRYPRAAQPPARPASLARARRTLIARARDRDGGLQVIRSRTTRIDGFPAVELDAFEHVAGQPRRVRSTHVFEPKAEVVLEEYAPAQLFHSVDHLVFSPLKRSLALAAAV